MKRNFTQVLCRLVAFAIAFVQVMFHGCMENRHWCDAADAQPSKPIAQVEKFHDHLYGVPSPDVV